MLGAAPAAQCRRHSTDREERPGRKPRLSGHEPLLCGSDLLFRLRIDDGARTDTLQAVDDDPVAGVKAGFTIRMPSAAIAELDLAIGDLVVRVDDEDELLVLVGADRALADRRAGFPPSVRPCAPARTGRGSDRPPGLSNTARTPMVPLAASTWLSMSCSLPDDRRALVVACVPISTGICSTGGLAPSSDGKFASALVTICSLALKLA